MTWKRLAMRKGKRASWIKSSLIVVSSGIIPAQHTHAAEHEIPTNRPVGQVLRPEVIQGPHCRVEDPVVVYDYEQHYIVASDWGPFEVTGDSALRKLIGEIYAIASLREVKRAKSIPTPLLRRRRHLWT